jgi:sec-independent protein translocase protein TatA
MFNGVLLFLNLGTQEVILIVFAVLLLFGGQKLPELARGLGKGIREFKDASDGVKREIHRNINQLTTAEELKREEELERVRDESKKDALNIEEVGEEDETEKVKKIDKTEV